MHTFLDSILTKISIPRKKVTTSSSLCDLTLIGCELKNLTHVNYIFKKNYEMKKLRNLHYLMAFKTCNPKKEFPFPSLCMLATFFTTFTWKIGNLFDLPFSLESNLLRPIPHLNYILFCILS